MNTLAQTLKKSKYYKYVLSLGHLCSDINQGALAAALPFLIAANNFDYKTAASLVMISNLFGSVVQPFFGNLADRRNMPWLMLLGVAMAGGGMGLLGWLNSFPGLCLAVCISGIGSALFHPQAAQLMSLAVPHNRQGQGISIFSFGGKLGYTLGPLVISFAVTVFGMRGTLIFWLFSLVFCSLCALFLPDFRRLNEEKISALKENAAQDTPPQDDNWSGFWRLCAVIFGRSIITGSMATFLSLYLIQRLGVAETLGNTCLSIFYGVGALVVLLGGSLGDKFGHRRVIRLSFVIFLTGLLLFLLSDRLWLVILLLLPLAAGESLSYSPMVVLGQRYLPNHTGLASGVTLGLSATVGAIFAPFLGMLADSFGLLNMFYAVAVVAAAALTAALTLPSSAGVE